MIIMTIILSTSPAQNESRMSASPDNDVFVNLAKTYSFSHATMHNSTPCSYYNYTFTDGITNGADWYPITGTADQLFLRSSPPHPPPPPPKKNPAKVVLKERWFLGFIYIEI